MIESKCGRSCAYWAFDMDMDPFCTHPTSMEIVPVFGASTNRMSREGHCPNDMNPLWKQRHARA